MIRWRQEGECRSYAQVPTGARVVEVNGGIVIGRCVGCGKYICDDHKYIDMEDEISCFKCATPEQRKTRAS